jgi:hypothetical protein
MKDNKQDLSLSLSLMDEIRITMRRSSALNALRVPQRQTPCITAAVIYTPYIRMALALDAHALAPHFIAYKYTRKPFLCNDIQTLFRTFHFSISLLVSCLFFYLSLIFSL